MKEITMIFLGIVFFVLLLTPYLVNGYKFTECDFEPNYKCEALHGVGVVVPPASYVTMWLNFEG